MKMQIVLLVMQIQLLVHQFLETKMLGKNLWQKGIEKVYSNGINGINSMPQKVGTDLSDEK